MKNFIIDFIKGMIIGVANIIPGVSGGTMAVTMGIYDKLIHIIGNVKLALFVNFKKTFWFMLPIGLGAVSGILLFSNLMKYLLEHYSTPTVFTFIGLIIGGMPLIHQNAIKNGFKKRYVIASIITFAATISLMFIDSMAHVKAFDINMTTMILLFVYGFIAASAMVIPGISGSFILMVLGVYGAILALVVNMQIILILPFAIGVICGILVFSKIIDWLLTKFYGYTYFGILGFVVASTALIFKDIEYSGSNISLSIGCLIIGAIFAYVFGEKTKNI